ncbi:MAG: sensor histidine kinase [Angustibacter sp.]
MRPLPVRWRVTAAFSGTLAVVLIGANSFVLLRLADELDQSIERGLRTRAAQIRATVQGPPGTWEYGGGSRLESDENPAQVLRPDGTVAGATARAGAALLSADQLRRALVGGILVDRPGGRRPSPDQPGADGLGVAQPSADGLGVDRPGAGIDEDLRLLAEPAFVDGEQVVIVVGDSLDERREALTSLALLQVLGSVIALVVSGAAGYAVAGVALRPVEAIRRRAELISDQQAGAGADAGTHLLVAAGDLAAAGDRHATDSPTDGPPSGSPRASDHESATRLSSPAVDDELGRLTRTLNAMLDRIDRARRQERELARREHRFVADASHELRTPLAVVRAEVDVVLQDAAGPAELRAALTSIGEEVDRLDRLTQDMLALARSTQLAPVDQVAHSVRSVLDAAAALVRPRLPAGRRLTVHCPDQLTATVNHAHLARAVADLLDNAVHHGEGDVRCSAWRTSSDVAIQVRDHGPGIPAAFVPRAFERFTRADLSRQSAGSGLGLAIVQAIVTEHRGRVELQNAQPGLTVRLILPQEGAHPPAGGPTSGS